MRYTRTSQAGHGLARSFGCVRVCMLVFVSLLSTLMPAWAQNEPSSFPKPQGGVLGGPVQKIDKAQPLYLQGDELIYDTRNNRVIARGNVEIYYNNYILTADQVIYDQNANTLTAEGNAQLKEPNGNIVRSDKLVTSSDFRDAFVQSLSVVAKDDTRIAARRAVRLEGNVTEFEQGKFTPCKNDPGKPPLWCISAARIVHDQQAATITYTDAQFELFGVPIFYLPYFSHPDPSVKRRSGFLAPEYGSSSTLGTTLEVPYYFALAPNYDFTFHPMYTTQHGALWMGDWRHRIAFGDIRGQYTFKFAAIDQDASTLPADVDLQPGRRAELDGWRGSVETKGLFSLSSWWRFGWDITLESDDTFRRFYKLDSVLQTDRVNTAYLQGLSDRNYFAATLYHFGGLLLEDQPTSESIVHPVIDYSYVLNQPVLGGELSWDGNAISLSRNDGTDMSRVAFQAQWRKKIIDGIGQVWTPFAQVRGDVTSFTNNVDPNTGTPVPEDTITRAMATAALTYAYPFVANTASGSHVVEPVAQIVARPASVSQRGLPDEDAKSLVWDDTLLFDVDKFSGWDRIETGTRANLGLQYTFQANSGAYARFIAGQSIHLAGTNPYTDPGLSSTQDPNGTFLTNFSPTSGLENDRSDYVLGAYLAPINSFRLVSQGRFDESDLSLRRGDVYGSYSIGPLAVQAQYTFTHTDPAIGILENQQDILAGLGLRLTENWSVGGVMRYDLDDSKRLQDQIQLRYADECFVLTASYTETFIDNPDLDLKQDRTFMLRFELKHLGEFKYKTDSLDHMFAENQPPK